VVAVAAAAAVAVVVVVAAVVYRFLFCFFCVPFLCICTVFVAMFLCWLYNWHLCF